MAKVFSMLFSEAAGGNAAVAQKNTNVVTNYNSSLSMVKYREPIFTYQGQGTKKQGVSPQEHAIAFSHGYTAQLLPDEAPLVKHAIGIVMKDGERPLSAASRIYFGIHHPIQYNVKVKDLGVVHEDWLPTFIGYWKMENVSDTAQSTEITNEAAQDDDS
ncbi:uncharacterized protein J4E79_001642 [Alternaria viburni]|uniref:uncharacterized protein n=1 Tax=Alternaria viburni TaxID=566460 RepID=UPI0020C52C71|nr:uncharacterized protein J4E79_001642 [Alternaria viburni]KAI4666961.1 hypothetical protein J4E79_001642 [Alternaria viburni]